MTTHLEPLDDDLVVEKELGRGTSGRVVLALQPSLGRHVAVKILAPLARESAGDFAREARIMARVAHPGIVPVLRHGELEGRPAIVMAYVDGLGLDAVLRELTGPGTARAARDLPARFHNLLGAGAAPAAGPKPHWWRIAARGVRNLARALDHAHRSGVLHRDIKPGNVLLDRSGRVLLADFGVAEDLGESAASSAGSLCGLAPELLAGERATRASDVYALGALLSEWASLQAPYDAESAAALVRAVDRGALRSLPRGLPSGLSAIRDRAMAQEPGQRYSTAADLARDLDALLEGRPLLAVRETTWARWSRGLRQHRRAVLTTGLLTLAMGGAASAYQLQRLAGARRVQAASVGARAHLDLAIEALSDVVIEAASGDLRGQPLLDRKRRELLVAGREGARALQQDLQPGETDLARAIGRAEADATLGLVDIERRLGHSTAARAALDALVDQLPTLSPADQASLRSRVAYVRFALDTDAGVDPTASAQAALDALDPEVTDGGGWFLRASAWSSLVESALAAGEMREAVRVAQTGVAELETTLESAVRLFGAGSSQALAARRELARIVGNLAAAQLEANDVDAAEASALRSIDLLRKLKPSASTRSIAAISFDNVAGARSRKADYAGARDATLEALRRHRRAAEAFPDKPDLAYGHARSARRLAAYLAKLNAPREERGTALGEAAGALRALVARPDAAPRVIALAAHVENDRARMASEARDWGAAYDAYESALPLAMRAHALGSPEWAQPELAGLWKRRMPFVFANRPSEAMAAVDAYVATFPADPNVAWEAGALLAALQAKRMRAKAPSDELRRLGRRSLELLQSAVDLGLTGRQAAATDTRIKHLVRVPSVARLLAQIPE